jgi:hypothetical protein
MNTDRVPVGLEQVRAELDAWRGQRRKGDRIPEGVWQRAAGAARQYGLNAVSRALRLDYYHLKRRAAGKQPRRQQPAPVFVELGTQATESELSCLVELEKGNGTRMRICVRDTVAVDWGKLKEAFLGA